MAVADIGSDRYRAEKRIGSGGMATVYLAHDAKLDRKVAYKLLADNLADDRSARRRFTREARLAARLSHPNVVQIFDVGEHDGRPYLVMEFIEGKTLDQLTDGRRRIGIGRAQNLLGQLAAGLAHAHEAGLVHRDIKPQNLLVRSDDCLKILDFGIARALEESKITGTGHVLGSGPYMAPEQIEGAKPSPATDVYAFGVVAYETLTGRTPHEYRSIEQLANAQRERRIEPIAKVRREVPEGLATVVMRCLDVEPTRRFQSAAELENTIEGKGAAVLPGRRLLGQKGGPRRRPRRKRPNLVAAIEKPSADGASMAGETAVQPAQTPSTKVGTRRFFNRPGQTRREKTLTVSPRALAIAAGAVALLVALVLVVQAGSDSSGSAGGGAGDGGGQGAKVEPIPQESDPGDQARALSDYLREHSD